MCLRSLQTQGRDHIWPQEELVGLLETAVLASAAQRQCGIFPLVEVLGVEPRAVGWESGHVPNLAPPQISPLIEILAFANPPVYCTFNNKYPFKLGPSRTRLVWLGAKSLKALKQSVLY